MPEVKELVCVNCPMGCRITVEMEGKTVLSVKGNSCPRGKAYAESECVRPMRILTSTVSIHNGTHRVLPVITADAIPLDLMKNPVFRTCLLVTVVSGLAYSGMNYLPMFYQRVKGMSSTASGMMTIPREIFMMTASFFTGIWLGKRGKYRQAMVLPILLFAVSVGMMALFRSVTPLLLLIIAEAFFGAADGMVLVSPNALAQRDLSPTEMGSGLSFLGFCSTIGNSAGSAITGCIVAQFWSADRAFADAEASVTALNHGLSMAFGLSFVCCVLLLIYLLRSGRNIEKSTV